MKTKTVERRTVKVLALALVMALVLPLLPALPSFAAANFTSITFEGVAADEENFYSDPVWFLNPNGDILANRQTSTEKLTGWESFRYYKIEADSAQKQVKFTPVTSSGSETTATSFKFTVQSNGIYANYAIYVSDGQTTVEIKPDSSGVYQIDTSIYGNFTNTDITISAKSAQTITLSTSAALSEYRLSKLVSGVNTVPSGELEFSITTRGTGIGKVPYVEYQKTTDDDFTELVADSTVPGAEGAVTYTYKLNIEAANYNVHFDLMNAVAITYQPGSFTDSTTYYVEAVSPTSSATSVPYGTESFQVKIHPDSQRGYEIASVTVSPSTASSSQTNNDDGTVTVTLTNVKQPVTITVTTKLKTLKVTLDQGDGAEGYVLEGLSDNQTFTYGSNLSFTITPSAGYGYPTVEYTVTGAGISNRKLTTTDGNYTISNITGDITITITNVNKTVYNWLPNIPNGVASLTYSEGSLTYGNSITFTITMEDGYTQSRPTLTVNGATVSLTTDDNGKTWTSTIPYEVKGDVTATVGGTIELNTYRVTVHSGEGITAPESVTVKHGSTASIQISVQTGYNNSTVAIQGWTKSGTGTTTQNWNSNDPIYANTGINITVEKIKLRVKDAEEDDENLEGHKGYTFTIENGEVPFNEPFEVTVEPTSGYKIENVKIQAGTLTANATQDASERTKWHCPGVTETCNITVEVAPIQIHVKWTTAGEFTDKNNTYNVEDGLQFCEFAEGKWTFDIGKMTEPKRYGFKFKNWDVTTTATRANIQIDGTKVTLESDDISLNITGVWDITQDLFTLSTTDNYVSLEKKLIFTTKILVNSLADDEAKAEYGGKLVTINNYGFFYGKDSTTLASGMDTTDRFNTYLNTHTEITGDKGQLAGDNLGEDIYFYSYAADVSFGVGNDTIAGNNYTQKFSKVESSATRSGLAWIKFTIDGQTYTSFGNFVQYTGQQ